MNHKLNDYVRELNSLGEKVGKGVRPVGDDALKDHVGRNYMRQQATKLPKCQEPLILNVLSADLLQSSLPSPSLCH